MWLVTWALGLPLDALETQGRRAVKPADEAKVDALIARRIETRKPAAYLTGEAWLQDVPFTIDERAIVPRSYIAELLVDAEEAGTLDTWLSERTRRVLDLCTGNGSLAVLAAMAYPEVVVDAADVVVVPVRFGSGRFLFVVAGIYMVGGAAYATGRSPPGSRERRGDRQ